MITDTGGVKVLDFGLAKLVAPPAGARGELSGSTHAMTLDGHILGTPAYMSPEQSKGRSVDARSDVFALGVVLYELVTGTRPFRGETAVELFIAIDRDEPAPPSTLNPRVPPALEAIVLRCLRKSPGERFASCREAAEALRRVSSGESPALTAVASGPELRLASIVRVTLPPADSSADALSPERAALVDVLAGYGAHATVFVGGSLMATFLLQPTGARAATDLAVQAARCAFAVRDAAPDTAIVIATGRALLAGSAPTGEAVDRAAAIAPGATGAAILLDELSAGLLDGRCRVRALGAGVFALDRAVLAADETRPLLGKPTPCVGRDAELAMLDIALGACRDDRVPRAVLVVAPPGQGKTRLCHEWLRRTEANTDPPLVLVGRADPVRGAAGGLLAQALRPALGVAEGATPDDARGALFAAVSRRVSTADAPRVAEMLGELCGVPFPDEGRVLLRSARSDPSTMAEQVERAWLAWLRATCAARTVVIVLEDLHWGDARTVSLVEAALRDLTDGALLVLALARPEVDERFPELWAGRAQRLVLGPLGRRASERLAREALGSTADLVQVERIVQLSEELVATMMRIEPYPDARRAYARMLALVLFSLCVTTSRGQLEPMLARLHAVCNLLAPSDPTARRWYSWAASSVASLREPAPWRALKAAEACLRDARLAGDRFIELWIVVNYHELQWWWLGDAAAEDRLRAQLQAAIHEKSRSLQFLSTVHLVHIACDKSDSAALAEGAQQMRFIAEDPHYSAFSVGSAYDYWARIELHERRPAAALAERSRQILAFAPLFALNPTTTLVRARSAEGRVADAVRVANEGLAVIAEFGSAGCLEVGMRLAACEALFTAGDRERARAELREALDQIRIRAEDIEDPGWRRSYLTRNVENRRARALAEAWGVADPTAALLSEL